LDECVQVVLMGLLDTLKDNSLSDKCVQVVLMGLLDTLKDNMPCTDAGATMCIGTN